MRRIWRSLTAPWVQDQIILFVNVVVWEPWNLYGEYMNWWPSIYMIVNIDPTLLMRPICQLLILIVHCPNLANHPNLADHPNPADHPNWNVVNLSSISKLNHEHSVRSLKLSFIPISCGCGLQLEPRTGLQINPKYRTFLRNGLGWKILHGTNVEDHSLKLKFKC